MPRNLDITDIVKNNPCVDPDDIEQILKVVEEAKRLNIERPGYRLATPMTPRHLPPVDHDNRIAKLQG